MVPTDDAGAARGPGTDADDATAGAAVVPDGGSATATNPDADSREGRIATGPGLGRAVFAGGLGGLVGAAAFGAVLLVIDPTLLRSTIPAFYGLEPRGTFGWAIHLLHGVVLGAVFGAAISRDAARTALIPTDPDQLGPGGVLTRLTAAGVAFGLLVWALLPMLVLPTLGDFGSGDQFGELTLAASESLLGHVVFGLFLGAVYGAVASRR